MTHPICPVCKKPADEKDLLTYNKCENCYISLWVPTASTYPDCLPGTQPRGVQGHYRAHAIARGKEIIKHIRERRT